MEFCLPFHSCPFVPFACLKRVLWSPKRSGQPLGVPAQSPEQSCVLQLHDGYVQRQDGCSGERDPPCRLCRQSGGRRGYQKQRLHLAKSHHGPLKRLRRRARRWDAH